MRNGWKPAYICGPLTDVAEPYRTEIKNFYERLASVCTEILGTPTFVPHQHYDPLKHALFTAREVDEAERRQVCENTSYLILVPVAPSWGGGIEVEMAYRSGVPIILVCNKVKLVNKQVSRLLRGNPGIKETVLYDTDEEAVQKLHCVLKLHVEKSPVSVR